MADQNVIISSDTVTVTGGEATLNVDVNFGPQGDDGSVILYGIGKPQNLDPSEFPRTPRVLDWYINTKTTDDEYLYIYQYVFVNNAGFWKRVFKIIPNSYQLNQIVEFDSNGVGSASVIVSNVTLPRVPEYAFPSTGDVVIPVDDEDAMVALSAIQGTYAFRKDLAKYYYLRKSPASNAANWEGLISINAHIDIENPLPVISSFQLSTPTINRDEVTNIITYTLPITLVAYQIVPPPTPDETVASVEDLLSVVPLDLGPDMIYAVYVTEANTIYILTGLDPSNPANWTPFSTIQPITGDRAAHISINVI